MKDRFLRLSFVGINISDLEFRLAQLTRRVYPPIIKIENKRKEVKKNMLKKILGMTMALAITLSMTGVASAHSNYQPSFRFVMPSNDITIRNDDTVVKTISTVDAYTGGNSQTGSLFGSQTLGTGGVVGITSTAQSEVNTTILPDCGCNLRGDISISNDDTYTKTVSSIDAKTGRSTQTAGMWTHQTLTTGGVQSIGTQATSLVNYTGFSVSAN